MTATRSTRRARAKGLRELARVLAPGGHLYLSVPSGDARVAFNAHRVFKPEAIIDVMQAEGLTLTSLSFDDRGCFHDDCDTAIARGARYGCGMYRLTR